MKTQKFIPVLVICVGLLVYCNSFRTGFVFDDIPHIVENPHIRQLWLPWEIVYHTSRPVVLLSVAVNYALGGLNPWGYHLFNTSVHILAALTLYGVVRRTFLSTSLRSRFGEAAPWLAGLVSLTWLVHPLQTESVTYVIQRGESLMGLFYLQTLYCIIRSSGSSRSIWWRAGAVVNCMLGMSSKPVMVTAPVVVFLYDRVFLSESWREPLKQRWMLYASLTGTWLLLPLLLANGSSEWVDSAGLAFRRQTPPLQYALTQPGVILHYLRLAFWPSPLCIDYGWGYGWRAARTVGDALPDLAVVGSLLTGTVWLWWWKPALGFLGVWFFMILAPTSSFVPIADLVAEHRMYLPLAAVISLVIASGFVLGRNLLNTVPQARRIVGSGVSLAIVIVLAILTIHRNHDYRSELAIWQDVAAKRPNNPRAHYNLGIILFEKGKVQEAIGQYEEALRIRPNYANAHYNLGLILARLGGVEEAMGHWEQVLRIKPDYAVAHYNLGNVLLHAGKPKDAIGYFEQALQIKPDYAEAHNDLAVALYRMGRVPEAIGHWEQALRIKPDYSDAHYNLGVTSEGAGRIGDAIRHYEQALRIKPDYADAQKKLARLRAVQ